MPASIFVLLVGHRCGEGAAKTPGRQWPHCGKSAASFFVLFLCGRTIQTGTTIVLQFTLAKALEKVKDEGQQGLRWFERWLHLHGGAHAALTNGQCS